MIETPLLSLLCFWDKGKPNFYEKQIKTPNLFYKKGGTPQIRAVPPMHKGWLSRLINYHFCRISQNLDEICSLLH